MDETAKLVKALLEGEGKFLIADLIRDEAIEDRHLYHGGYDDVGYHSVLITVSVDEFLYLKRMQKLESTAQTILAAFQDASSGKMVYYDEVKIAPGLNVSGGNTNNGNIPKANVDEEDFNGWTPGWFRMFISHVSEHKISAVNLKTALARYRISGFVAHEDVTPAAEWIHEIDAALRSMDGLCAIMTPTFAKSDWCDQEVGYGLGRKIICIPIKKDTDPYGFLGRYQAVSSKDKNAHTLAHDIFTIVSTDKRSRQIYQRKLADILLNSRQSAEALEVWKLFDEIHTPETDILEYIQAHMKANKALMTQASLKEANAVFMRHGLEAVEPAPSVPSSSLPDDDELDLPF